MVVFQVYRRSASKAAVCERVLHDVGAIHEVLPAFAPKVQRAQICNWRYSTALTAVFCDWHFSVEAAQFPILCNASGGNRDMVFAQLLSVPAPKNPSDQTCAQHGFSALAAALALAPP